MYGHRHSQFHPVRPPASSTRPGRIAWGLQVKKLSQQSSATYTPLGWGGVGWGGVSWVGLGWVGLGWVGLGWGGVGLGWVGVGWVGLGWGGVEWRGILTRTNLSV